MSSFLFAKFILPYLEKRRLPRRRPDTRYSVPQGAAGQLFFPLETRKGRGHYRPRPQSILIFSLPDRLRLKPAGTG